MKKKLENYKNKSIVACESLTILEVNTDEKTGVKKAVIQIITEGATKDKQRFYTKPALEAGAAKFEGAKMYLNHISASERFDRPERSVNDYVATIKNPRFMDGTPSRIIADAYIHGSPTYSVEDIYSWLKNVKEAGASADLSIHAFLTGNQGEFNSMPIVVIEGIDEVVSVDFVTTANAGGEVATVESNKTDGEKGGGEEMDITKLTLEELKAGRPDLIEAVSKEATAKVQTSSETESVKAENETLKKKISDRELEDKKESLHKDAESVIKEAKLPETTEARVREKVSAITITATTESIKDEVAKIVKAEKDYLESLSKTKVFGNDNDEKKPGEKSVDEMLESITTKKNKK